MSYDSAKPRSEVYKVSVMCGHDIFSILNHYFQFFDTKTGTFMQISFDSLKVFNCQSV